MASLLFISFSWSNAVFTVQRQRVVGAVEAQMALMQEKLSRKEAALDKYNGDLIAFTECKVF